MATDPLPEILELAKRLQVLATPTTTPPVDPPVDPPPTGSGKVLYSTTYDNFNDLLGFKAGDGGWFQQDGGTLTQGVDPSNAANKVLKAQINPGGSRAEAILALNPAQTDFKEGDDLWFASRIRLAPNYPLAERWQLIQQWKQGSGSGSPPIELDCELGNWRLSGGEVVGKPFKLELGPAQVDTWTKWLFHIKFSSNSSVGRIDAWRDGNQVVNGKVTATMYPGTHIYPKCGYYRSRDIKVSSYVLWDYYRIGTTRASVDF